MEHRRPVHHLSVAHTADSTCSNDGGALPLETSDTCDDSHINDELFDDFADLQDSPERDTEAWSGHADFIEPAGWRIVCEKACRSSFRVSSICQHAREEGRIAAELNINCRAVSLESGIWNGRYNHAEKSARNLKAPRVNLACSDSPIWQARMSRILLA